MPLGFSAQIDPKMPYISMQEDAMNTALMFGLLATAMAPATVNHHWAYLGEDQGVYRWAWVATVSGQYVTDELVLRVAASDQHDLSTLGVEILEYPDWSQTQTDWGTHTEIIAIASGQIVLGDRAEITLAVISSTAPSMLADGYTHLAGGGPFDTAWIRGPINTGGLLDVDWTCAQMWRWNRAAGTTIIDPGYLVEADIDQDCDVDGIDRGYVLLSQPGGQSGWCAGDADMSGHVDQLDLALVLRYYGQHFDGFFAADLTGDGDVNEADLQAVLDHYGEGGDLAVGEIIGNW